MCADVAVRSATGHGARDRLKEHAEHFGKSFLRARAAGDALFSTG